MSTLALPSLSRPRWRRPLPGFGLSLGLGMAWLGVVVLLPLAALTVRAAGLGSAGWLRAIQDERVQAALKVSFGASFAAATTGAAFRLADDVADRILAIAGQHEIALARIAAKPE